MKLAHRDMRLAPAARAFVHHAMHDIHFKVTAVATTLELIS
ncbi:hypothetical protein [Candidatus Litorirhabdus singularis]|nr:hypothetical protein [Candidatus Litorirhabdus singularis]